MKRVFCQIPKCLACRSCELACAVAHSRSKNLVDAIRENPLPKHRIQVESIDAKGGLYPVRAIALQCRHCEDPMCAQACISGGINRDEKTGEMIADPAKCVACWSCIMVCPFGVIVKYEDCHQAVKCDHCPDRETPACVESCPTGALVYCSREEIQMEIDTLAK